jgi:hypothetical protein
VVELGVAEEEEAVADAAAPSLLPALDARFEAAW